MDVRNIIGTLPELFRKEQQRSLDQLARLSDPRGAYLRLITRLTEAPPFRRNRRHRSN